LPGRQTLMFSATWPKSVQSLCKDYLINPIRVNMGSLELSANPDIKQEFVFCESDDRVRYLSKMLKDNPPRKTLIFVQTKYGVDILAKQFVDQGIHDSLPFATIHGDKTQTHRNNIMTDFKNDELKLVIATDVASRGIDVKDIDVVINYDMPQDIGSYIHRIGRTARAGKKGVSLTYLTPENEGVEKELIAVLEKAGQIVPDQLLKRAKSSGSGSTRYGDEHLSRSFQRPGRPSFRQQSPSRSYEQKIPSFSSGFNASPSRSYEQPNPSFSSGSNAPPSEAFLRAKQYLESLKNKK